MFGAVKRLFKDFYWERKKQKRKVSIVLHESGRFTEHSILISTSLGQLGGGAHPISSKACWMGYRIDDDDNDFWFDYLIC